LKRMLICILNQICFECIKKIEQIVLIIPIGGTFSVG